MTPVRTIDGHEPLLGGIWVRQWLAGLHLHRVDGPAVEGGGLEQWYQYGQPHRDDGAAFITGESTRYFLRGIEFHWALPPSLWAVAAVRNQLLDRVRGSQPQSEDQKQRQRAKALKLLHKEGGEIDPDRLRASITEAWTAPDAGLRRWGQRAAARLPSHRTLSAKNYPVEADGF